MTDETETLHEGGDVPSPFAWPDPVETSLPIEEEPELPEGWVIRQSDAGVWELVGPMIDETGAVVGEHAYARIPAVETEAERRAHFAFILSRRAGKELTAEQIAEKGY